MKTYATKLLLALLTVGVAVAAGIWLDQAVGVPIDTSYRVACAAVCIGFLAKLARDGGNERWAWYAVAIAAFVDTAMFATPVFDRPASRGEIMLFALPDAAIFLGVRAFTYPVHDVHDRAVRQQLILGFVLACAFGALLLASTLIPDCPAHGSLTPPAPPPPPHAPARAAPAARRG